METDLRDLDEDRRYCRPEDSAWDTPTEIRLKNLAIAALDEIDRLKRLIVRRWPAGGFIVIAVTLDESCGGIAMHSSKGFEGWWFENESDAWAAVRKAASNGK